MASFLSIPSADNNGGLYSQAANLLVRAKPLDAVMQSRDIDDSYAKANTDEFMSGKDLDGYSALEGLGRAILSGRLVDTGIEYTDENKTYYQGVNGMLNVDANIAVNMLEQNTNISAEQPRSNAAVTSYAQPTHGPLADVLEAFVEKLNIGINQFILRPLSWGASAATGSKINLQFAWDGDSRGAMDYVSTVRNVNGAGGALFPLHSQGNEVMMLALQSLGKDYLYVDNPIDGTNPYLFTPNGSPVNNQLAKSIIEYAGGTFLASSTNANDPVSEGLGGNKGNYAPQGPVLSDTALDASVSNLHIPLLSDFLPLTLFTSAIDAPSFFYNKYPVYNRGTEDVPIYTYIKPSPDAKPVNKTSPHGGYPCSAALKCGDAFGGPADKKYLNKDVEKGDVLKMFKTKKGE